MKLRLAICDERMPEEAQRGLTKMGYRVLTLPPCSRLSPPVASHTDMLLFRLGGEYISFADYCDEAPFVFTDLCGYLPGVRITLTADTVSERHPHDAPMNALLMGDKLFARLDSLSPYIKDRCAELGIRTVGVRQGYPACTVLRLSDRAAITADRGMARAMSECGIKVTLIDNGGISLPPYEYGFIGGAAGVDGDRIYFIGDPGTHPSGEVILAAARSAGLTPLSLCSGGLIDLGGILFAEGEA